MPGSGKCPGLPAEASQWHKYRLPLLAAPLYFCFGPCNETITLLPVPLLADFQVFRTKTIMRIKEIIQTDSRLTGGLLILVMTAILITHSIQETG